MDLNNALSDEGVHQTLQEINVLTKLFQLKRDILKTKRFVSTKMSRNTSGKKWFHKKLSIFYAKIFCAIF